MTTQEQSLRQFGSEGSPAVPRNISHLAIGVSDMEASLTFYCQVIGLQLAVDKIEVFSLPEFKTERRGCYLRWSGEDDSAFIVLDQTLNSDRPRGGAKPLFDIGVHHFGFWVDDVDAIIARARSSGHTVVMDPVEADSQDYGEEAGRQIRAALLKDPDGNVVQLDQRVR